MCLYARTRQDCKRWRTNVCMREMTTWPGYWSNSPGWTAQKRNALRLLLTHFPLLTVCYATCILNETKSISHITGCWSDSSTWLTWIHCLPNAGNESWNFSCAILSWQHIIISAICLRFVPASFHEDDIKCFLVGRKTEGRVFRFGKAECENLLDSTETAKGSCRLIINYNYFIRSTRDF